MYPEKYVNIERENIYQSWIS